MEKSVAIYIFSGLITILGPVMADAHVGSVFLPEGCGSCHVGHGLSNEPMLAASQEESCYQCHGSADMQSDMISNGKLASAAALADIEREFQKPYRHPVEASGEHSPDERLPDFSKANITHAECVDCHNPHQSIHGSPGGVAKVPGYTISGQYVEEATREYEICLKCHTSIAGGPSSKDIKAQFSPSVRSMHPVTRPSTGMHHVSLKSTGMTGTTMTCSDCHGSDDPEGPRGPHGSMFRYMLKGNYSTEGTGEESPLAYEFCYSCHDRGSILGNKSFPFHREHIEGDPFAGIPGTSCYTCHSSHSSEDNPYLIRFNRQVVKAIQPGNLVRYRSLGNRSGECYLDCHGHSHEPERY